MSTQNDVDRLLYAEMQKKKNYATKKERRANDINFRLKEALRNRVRTAMKTGRKCEKTAKLVGYPMEELKEHLEAQFQDGMTMENYGEWHMDHIVPCNFFDLSKRINQLMCFNYRNLQPLWGPENILKSDTLTDQGKEKLVELELIFGENIDISGLAETFFIKKEETEKERRLKISETVKQYNQTSFGKSVKDEAIEKGLVTKKEKKDKLNEETQKRGTQFCSRCKQEVILSEFRRRGVDNDNLQAWCNECTKLDKRERKIKDKAENPGKLHNCLYCSIVYKDRWSVGRHIREKHADKLAEILLQESLKTSHEPKKLTFKKID